MATNAGRRRSTGGGAHGAIRRLLPCAALACCAADARAQDSVAITPGGNDSFWAWSSSLQRTRYALDLAEISSSWGGVLLVGPAIKAHRDPDPMFRTFPVIGAAASAGQLQDVATPPTGYFRWIGPGIGVNPGANSPAATETRTHFDRVFSLALNDAVGSASAVAVARVGQDSVNLSRLWIERTTGACSREGTTAPDGSTLALGGVDSEGRLALRVDAFGLDASSPAVVAGDSLVRIDAARRSPSLVNTLARDGDGNAAEDGDATSFVADALEAPVAPPAIAMGVAMALDFELGFGLAAGDDDFAPDPSHLASAAGHRGAPSYSITPAAGGGAGTVACIATLTNPGPPDALLAFGLEEGGPAGLRIAQGTMRIAQLDAPVSGENGWTGNASGGAEFAHFRNQTSFRAPAGHVGAGQTAAGELVLAATATDTDSGEFIAVATLPQGGGSASWSVAAHEGMSVRSSPGGPPIGQLIEGPGGASLSSPAVDLLGNVYFVGAWRPSAGVDRVGLFKAVRTQNGYQLERLLSTGQIIRGVNSATDYIIASLALSDGDSVSGASLHAGSVVQAQIPGRGTTTPASPFAFGGLAVSATIEYQRPGPVGEAYDALLFVGPGIQPVPGDTNADGLVNFTDLNNVLTQFGLAGPGLLGDLTGDNQVNFSDLNIVLANFGQPPR